MESTLMKIYECYDGGERDLLLKAYDFAKAAHKNQKRASGEPYFIHPCAVAEILTELGLNAVTIAAALLHDVIEDTSTTAEDLRREFGEETFSLVEGVTKLDKIVFKSEEEEEAENFRKIFIAMAKDIRVILIKLADRLHNMRSLNFLSKERQLKMARETLDIYAPIAGRLGISQIKCELEDLCLKYIDPSAFEFLVENIHQKLEERNAFVDFVVEEINGILKESGIKGEVFGRPKHFYSIYKKMKSKDKSLEQIYDLTAVRVIVGTVDECYEVFGKIHKKWKPVPMRIKDYIATPKPNLYQSLHTTVVTNFGQPFEIQIRTEEMHRTAEFGIAAHWKYKEQRDAETSLDQRIAWIREVMDMQGGFKDSKEFMDTVKGELYSTELLVFTPQSKVISLPSGATPVDFAYAIHSEVGNKCTGAKVNGKIVPLNSVLELGDVVEIITSPNSKGPSRDWLKFIKSSSARAKIKSFYRKEMKEENIRTGKSILEEAVKRKGYTMQQLLTAESFKLISEKLSFDTQDEMFSALGYGAINVNQILFKLIDFYRKEVPQPVSVQPFQHHAKGSVTIKGMSGLLVTFAGCCSPVPGDEIVGFVTRGRGIVVHRKDCPNMRNADEGRLQPAEWVGADKDARFKAAIVVTADDQGAALAAISGSVAEMKLAITSINGRYDKNGAAVVDVTVSLTSRNDVDVLIKKIKSHAKILDVRRTSN
ncbi:MAG: bifunctional (p)ppGpp synthetase/guanosine-3',5'-bis(diphosphate) 3'-pyrophosphohydrolase [Clostridia bacterium]|jgi:GTP pyrophosphokinase|nr:bifunctional (p)ppGpp synthetase/guanosine-3',5'-bis(diphosphate) 3'-pyrophosphohydrolase [Clostridia bacterium]